MKHSAIILLSSLMIALAACNNNFKVTRLVLHPSSVETTPLDTIQLVFAMDYSGGDFDDPNLIKPQWHSSNDDVVGVDSLGKIFTRSTGNAEVTISCGGASASCKVTVISQNQPR